jgi:hypothetical protein
MDLSAVRYQRARKSAQGKYNKTVFHKESPRLVVVCVIPSCSVKTSPEESNKLYGRGDGGE